ncbi:hypothetical protein C8R48DRAFT_770859 [Suillus tomentosus]|nr:hypothetical protein C8R48DRAFT_770859 [Suillus tomentosus]
MEAGLDDLLLNSKANQPVLHCYTVNLRFNDDPLLIGHPKVFSFFDGVPPNRSNAALPLLSITRHASQSSIPPQPQPLQCSCYITLDWARNILKWRRQPSPAVVEVSCAPGLRRNACAREKQKKPPPKIPTASSSQPPKPNVTQSSSQPQAGSSSTPPIGDATGIATTSTTSRPDAMIRKAGLWTRF